jgi:hypothetical protein
MGWLFVGIKASIMMYFILGFGTQWWLRKHHPHLFNKYNYIVSAALDGGTQVCVFILTFAVFGGSGTSHAFPYVSTGSSIMDILTEFRSQKLGWKPRIKPQP